MIKPDSIEQCKEARKSGARIFRIDTWIGSTNSKKNELFFESLTLTRRPNWKSSMGYVIDRTSEYWQKMTLGEKIAEMR